MGMTIGTIGGIRVIPSRTGIRAGSANGPPPFFAAFSQTYSTTNGTTMSARAKTTIMGNPFRPSWGPFRCG